MRHHVSWPCNLLSIMKTKDGSVKMKTNPLSEPTYLKLQTKIYSK